VNSPNSEGLSFGQQGTWLLFITLFLARLIFSLVTRPVFNSATNQSTKMAPKQKWLLDHELYAH